MMYMSMQEAARRLGGRVEGNHIRCPGPGHSRVDDTLIVWIDGYGIRVFSHAGDDWRACRDHVRALLGMQAWAPGQRIGPGAPFAPYRPAHGHAPASNDDAARALNLWEKGKPISGTAAETYLRVARRIPGPLPPTLRFLPPHGNYAPALMGALALATEGEPQVLFVPKGALRAIHLTALKPDGSGKADVPDPKKIIGRGAQGVPVVVAAPNDLLGLAITEGIEDALSIHAATGLGAWAACGAGRLAALAQAVPSYIDLVTIYADDDEAGMRWAKALLCGLTESGIRAHIKLFAPSMEPSHG